MSAGSSPPRFKLLGAPAKRSTGRVANACWWVGYALVGATVQFAHYGARETSIKIRKGTSVGALLAGAVTVLYHFLSSDGDGDRTARFRFFLRSRVFSPQAFLYWWDGLSSEKTQYPSYEIREAVRKRDDYRCRICGADGGPEGGAELHVDHVVPRKWGGSNRGDNLRTLCLRCHGLRHLTSFRD